jgi:methionine--tRNA ligase beta chain
MSFLQRILNTEKVQKMKVFTKSIIKDAKKTVSKLAKKADKDMDISEKVDEMKDTAKDFIDTAKNEVDKLDDKFEISEKLSDIKERVSDIAEKAGDQIESVLDNKISFDTFLQTEIKVGEIVDAEEIEKSDKLLKLTVSFGKDSERQIISGIKKSYTTEEITGKKAIFVTNLEPRKIMGLESDGMILGVSDGDNFSILSPEKSDIPAGTQAS